MSFQLQSDVPMPSRRNRYPFATMISGQSFEIQGEEEARKVRNAAYQYAKKANTDTVKAVTEGKLAADEAVEVKFALRKTDEVDSGTVDAEGKPVTVKIFRLWRE